MDAKNKISILWIFFLFGMVLDIFFPLMPLFAGSLKAVPGVDISMIGHFRAMTAMVFIIPMTVISGVMFIEKNWMRIVNFVMSVLLTLMNVMHLAEHTGMDDVDPAVIAVLVFVFLSGVALNVVSYKWIKEKADGK